MSCEALRKKAKQSGSAFDVILSDIFAARVRKASFSGLIQTEHQVEKVVKTLKRHKSLMELDMSWCYFGENDMNMLCSFLKAKDCCVRKLNVEDCELRMKELDIFWDAIKFNKSVKGLNISSNFFSWSGVSDAIKQNVALTELDARESNRIAPHEKHFTEALVSHPSLTSLILSDSVMGDGGAEVISDILKVNQLLKNICLGWNRIQSRGAKAIGDALSYNRSLTRLVLSDNKLLCQGAQAIAEGLKRNDTILELSLARTHIGQCGCVALCDALKVNSSLTVWDVSGNNFGPAEGRSFAEMLKRNRTLTSLDVGKNVLGEEGLLAIAEGLQVNQVLKKLFVSRVGGDATRFLDTCLRGNQTLTNVDVSFNRVGVDGDRLIGELLKTNTTLRKLRLFGVELRAFQAIAEGIQVNTSLIVLDMGGNHLGDAGARVISDALLVNQTLRELQLCNVSLADFCDIARMLSINKGLKSLDLSSNRVGHAGFIVFAEALKANDTLETLDVCGCDLNANCASAFRDLLESNKALTELNVSENDFEGCSQIVAESIFRSQTLRSINLIDCGLKKDHILSAISSNKNVRKVDGLDDYEIEAFCARNRFLREFRVEQSVVILMALRNRMRHIPKEMLMMIGKYLIKTIEDPLAWAS